MYSVPYGKELLVMLAGYALGCFTSGYYLVRWRTGHDIRMLGSGSVGATNVSRVLGLSGFFLTVLCDFGKGMLAVWLAEYFRINPTATVLTMLAVTTGHVWPAQLWFHSWFLPLRQTSSSTCSPRQGSVDTTTMGSRLLPFSLGPIPMSG